MLNNVLSEQTCIFKTLNLHLLFLTKPIFTGILVFLIFFYFTDPPTPENKLGIAWVPNNHKVSPNLPNKGARRDSKVKYDTIDKKLRFWAFKQWFGIENWSIIKGN